MSDDRFNHEGYRDPLPQQALKNLMERKGFTEHIFRPLVYICSAYRGDVETNIRKAREYCRQAVEHGVIPIAPHLLFPQFMDDSILQERNLAIFMDSVILTKCSEIWVFGKEFSEGMREDMENARKLGKVFRYFNEDFSENKEALWN